MDITLAQAQSAFFDVVIVGAGPAGSSAAFHFVQAGCSVLLVDRAIFPRAKACGDAVMPPALAELAQLGLLEDVRQQFYRVEAVGQGVKTILATLPIRTIDGFTEGYMAPREQFDQLLCEHACQHGATLLPGVTLTSFTYEPDGIIVVGTTQEALLVKLRTKLVIIADGSASRLAQQLRVWHFAQPSLDTVALTLPHAHTQQRHAHARFTALRGYLPLNVDPSTLAFYFPLLGDVHYYWAFPVNRIGLANIGVIATLAQTRAISSDGKKIDLRQSLSTFFQCAQDTIDQLSAAPIATGLQDSALYGDRILCVGDAAALAEPGYAEGISAALWSGRMAAQVGAKALRRGDLSLQALRPYGLLVRQRYEAAFQKALKHV